jgi:hypothetical protein
MEKEKDGVNPSPGIRNGALQGVSGRLFATFTAYLVILLGLFS